MNEVIGSLGAIAIIGIGFFLIILTVLTIILPDVAPKKWTLG